MMQELAGFLRSRLRDKRQSRSRSKSTSRSKSKSGLECAKEQWSQVDAYGVHSQGGPPLRRASIALTLGGPFEIDHDAEVDSDPGLDDTEGWISRLQGACCSSAQKKVVVVAAQSADQAGVGADECVGEILLGPL